MHKKLRVSINVYDEADSTGAIMAHYNKQLEISTFDNKHYTFQVRAKSDNNNVTDCTIEEITSLTF